MLLNSSPADSRLHNYIFTQGYCGIDVAGMETALAIPETTEEYDFLRQILKESKYTSILHYKVLKDQAMSQKTGHRL